MKASVKLLRITPKKLNLIAQLVRNKNATEAMAILDFAPKKGAALLNKVIASAVANAKNNFKQDEKSLYIKEIIVNKAPTYKRSIPISRGRTHPILKRNARVSVVIGVKEEAPKKTGPKAEIKAEAPKKEPKSEPKKPTKTIKAS